MENASVICKEKRVKLPYFGRIKNPQILEDILKQLPENCVLCEFLNRVVGGVSYEIMSPENASHYKGDPSRELKHIYTRAEIDIKTESLKQSYH